MQVDIIMPVHNSEKFLEESLRSVLSQTYSNWNLYVINDFSTDKSKDIMESFSYLDNRIKIFNTSYKSGAAEARNIGIRQASGDFLAFLDADDLWYPEKLAKQLSFMLDNKIALSYSAYDKIDQHGNYMYSLGVPEKVSYKELLKTCVIGCLTAMYDRRKLGTVLMPSINKRQDFGLWLKILKEIPYAYGINTPLASYRVSNESLSNDKRIAAYYTWKLYREVEGLPITSSVYNFAHYSIRGYLRKNHPNIARRIKVLKDIDSLKI